MKPPQFQRKRRRVDAEVLVNPNVVAESDDSDELVNMHPQSADSGPWDVDKGCLKPIAYTYELLSGPG